MTTRLSGLLIALCLLLCTGVQASPFGAGLGGDLPSVDQAIQVSAQPDWERQQILVSFSLIDHVYLYQQRLAFSLYDTSGKKIRQFPLPKLSGGVTKNDAVYGNVTVFYNHLDVVLPVQSLPDRPTRLKVDYQGCIEDTLCYPPESRTFDLPAASPGGAAQPASEPPHRQAAAPAGEGFVSTLLSQDAGSFSAWISTRSLALVLGLFFVGGILLAFTPCVFPMLPILSGIIAGEARPSARRGFILSVAYVLGVAVPYTLAGLLVALFGAGLNLQFLLQQPAAIITSAVIFVLLALSMFGLYELQLPERLRSRLNSAGGSRNGGIVGAVVLGIISALVVSPCVTPILAGALIYVAGSGDALTGALSLFVLAIGMGVPLILVGTGGGHLLPRAGQWMDDVKRLFGVIMLAVAIWLLSRIISEMLVLGLYGLLLIVYGVQLGALEAVAPGGSRFKRGVALALALYGVLLLVGATGGATNPWQPLTPFAADGSGQAAVTTVQASPPASSAQPGQWQTLPNGAALAAALQRSASAGRPVLVDFFAEWCVACKELEQKTLNQPQVLAAMKHFDLYQVDITDITPENQALMSRYDIFGLPSLIFFDPSGEQISGARILGFMGPQRFLEHLDRTVTPALNP